MMSTTTTFREYRLKSGVRLDTAELAVLRSAFPSMDICGPITDSSCYEVMPGHHIGVVQVSDRVFVVQPKVSIPRLGFALSYALDLVEWQDRVPYATAGSLADLVAALFADALAGAVRRGLLQGYRSVEETAMTIRGRIRIDEQLRRRPGRLIPIEVGFDDFTEDIDANRVLRGALHRLSRLPLRHERTRRKLAVLQGPFVETVSLVEYRRGEVPVVALSRLGAHCRPAVELAKLILESTTPEVGGGDVDAAGFVVDMNKVFEAFVRSALRQALGLSRLAFPPPRGHMASLDRAKRVGLEPDLSWWEGGRCTFVGDAKYKAINVAGVKHADLYQLLAYVAALDLPGGLLVYAAGEVHEVVHEVELGATQRRLEVVTVDLDGAPEKILRSIATIANRVTALRRLACEIPSRPMW